MANIDDINLFHKLNVEREIIPNKYQLLISNNNCKHYNKPNLKSIGNLQEIMKINIFFIIMIIMKIKTSDSIISLILIKAN